MSAINCDASLQPLAPGVLVGPGVSDGLGSGVSVGMTVVDGGNCVVAVTIDVCVGVPSGVLMMQAKLIKVNRMKPEIKILIWFSLLFIGVSCTLIRR